ncbi:MAG: undecaprenyl-phosphate glucose phosphotransferase [Candidatus Amulumruptor caecigallinarius]|nr:undecaprenyl-phosphate glucose phosphotransferase [Candidatus Amulumruptor caecigallinarius]MCM1397069.1 undecaprenyl-phosphate glucose phosphotransferase [Candidatus Amulumruptor caecigallinarius]MCM1454055.1 undecaprenyl-phosphate glucose phosphotransferase [bacterium]
MPLTFRTGRYGRYLSLISDVVGFGALNLAYWLTLMFTPPGNDFNSRMVWLMINLVFLVLLLWRRRQGYNRSATMERMLTLTLRTVVLHALLFIPVLYFLGLDSIGSRVLVIFYAILLGCVMLTTVILQLAIHAVRKRGHNSVAVVVVGGGPQAERLVKRMGPANNFGYRVVGLFGPQPREGSVLEQYYVGPVDELDGFIEQHTVDEVYYVSDQPVAADVTRAAQSAEARMLQFNFVPQIPPSVLGRFHVSSLGSVPVLSLKETPLKNRFNAGLKRAFDFSVSLVAITILAPLVYVPVAIAIKRSSPGPVFFRQKRTGLLGREFLCYKFRTMKVNADSDKVQATKDDPRKTRVGEFLRHSSIDELPQLINVLKGDMSLVGPRPHMLAHTEQYSALIDQYMVRHAVRPGITGWAQVNGYRGQTDELWQMTGRVEHDVWYIEHWSFLLDLKIMAKTVINAVRGEENAF